MKHKVKYFSISSITLLLFTSTCVFAEEFEATLGWSKRVELSTPVNGVVQKVYAKSGTIVAKGEVLIQLDPRIYKADLKYAKAQFKNSSDRRKEAKRELDRQTDMYERTMLSDHDLQISKNNFTSARAEFHQAQSLLAKAKLNLEYSAIRSPFNSIVISADAVRGQVVASEITPPVLVVVAEAHRMLAQFYVTADKVNNITINQAVKVNFSGRVHQGKVVNIAMEPDKATTGYYAVDVIFESKDKILRAGQKVKVDL